MRNQKRGVFSAIIQLTAAFFALNAYKISSAYAQQTTVRTYKAVALLHAQAMVAQDIGKVVILDPSSLQWDSDSANGYGTGYDASNKNLVYDETLYGGQIVVQMNCTGCYADTRRLWVIIPRGLMPGTNVPMIQFLRYVDSGKTADTVRNHVIPPGGGPSVQKPDPEPVVDYSIAGESAKRLYVLRKNLMASVQQLSPISCSNHCDPVAWHKTKDDLVAFKKGTGEFLQDLRNQYIAAVARKDWLDRHGMDSSEAAKAIKVTTDLQQESSTKDSDYASWVEDQLVRRSIDSNIPWGK